jgi:hypothetical protein
MLVASPGKSVAADSMHAVSATPHTDWPVLLTESLTTPLASLTNDRKHGLNFNSHE